MTKFNELRTAMLLVIVAAFIASPSVAQTDTTFTYQGELKQDGEAVNGQFDLTFSLWDVMSGGTEVGQAIVMTDVQVTDGLVTVALDFGAPAFDNSNRWLEIEVEGATLSPRTFMTRSPYSIQTRGIFVDANNAVGIGTLTPEGPLHVQEGSAGNVTAWADSIAVLERNGHGYLSILSPEDTERGIFFGDVASNVNGGIIYNNATLREGFQFRTQNQTRMVIFDSGHVGVNSALPNNGQLTVEADATADIALVGTHQDGGTGVLGSTTNAGGGVGVYGIDTGPGIGVQGQSTTGQGVYGIVTSTTGPQIGVYGQATSTSGSGVTGVAAAATGLNYGVVGTSFSTSGFDFYANGPGVNYGSPSSIRWKRNIEAVTDPLGMLAQIRGVFYDWDEEHGGQHDIGFIGEEVGKVLPEIVGYEEDGEFVTGMDYSKMTPILVEAVNALRVENENLRERLVSLEQLVGQMAATQLEKAK